MGYPVEEIEGHYAQQKLVIEVSHGLVRLEIAKDTKDGYFAEGSIHLHEDRIDAVVESLIRARDMVKGVTTQDDSPVAICGCGNPGCCGNSNAELVKALKAMLGPRPTNDDYEIARAAIARAEGRGS